MIDHGQNSWKVHEIALAFKIVVVMIVFNENRVTMVGSLHDHMHTLAKGRHRFWWSAKNLGQPGN